VAIVLDCIYQLITVQFIYPLELLFTATLLALIPYVLLRGPFNRIARLFLPNAGAPRIETNSKRSIHERNHEQRKARPMSYESKDWSKPAAMAIPKEGFFKDKVEQGRYGPIVPKTPACYGFSVVAKVKPGRERAIRDYGKTIEEAVKADPDVLAPLRLHYLRWVLFDVGSGLHFMYQGIFDTDFDKYLEDAVALLVKTGITTVFTNLEGWPEDWKTNVAAVIEFFRSHQCPSFLEYGEYPYVSADEIKKALKLKAAFSTMLDQMQ
jgi:hypothetical protein